MIYRRLPRVQSDRLSREQLRVYTMCDGRNTLSEVIKLTRLEPETVRTTVQELLKLGLLEVISTAPAPGTAAQSAKMSLESQAQPSSQVQPSDSNSAPSLLTTLFAQAESVLRSQIGEKAEPHLVVLRSCTTVEELQEQGSRLAVKLKLTVNRQVSEALVTALRSSA